MFACKTFDIQVLFQGAVVYMQFPLLWIIQFTFWGSLACNVTVFLFDYGRYVSQFNG